MSEPDRLEMLRKHEIPGIVALERGEGGLPRIKVTTEWSRAEIYLHGAQVTGFEKIGEPPLLFLSRRSHFIKGKAIRGGAPICFPWFGSRPGEPGHGYARITDWDLASTKSTPQEGAALRFKLPDAKTNWAALLAEFEVRIGDRLSMELLVTNGSEDQPITFENCLHTYFSVGEIGAVSITGLTGCHYLDETQEGARQLDTSEAIRVRSRIDRTYLDTTGPVEINDEKLQRIIRIEKSGAASTIVWNPWTTQPLEDFGPDEYQHMVCVESGNVGPNSITLLPGQHARMAVVLSSSHYCH